MHFAHSRGAKVIAITDTPASPIAELASYLLLAHSDMATVVDSLVAPLSVINALIVAASLRKMDSVTQTLTELEELWVSIRRVSRSTARIERWPGGNSMGDRGDRRGSRRPDGCGLRRADCDAGRSAGRCDGAGTGPPAGAEGAYHRQRAL